MTKLKWREIKVPQAERTSLQTPHAPRHHPFRVKYAKRKIIFFYSRPNGLKSEQIGRPPDDSDESSEAFSPFYDKHFAAIFTLYFIAVLNGLRWHKYQSFFTTISPKPGPISSLHNWDGWSFNHSTFFF